MMPGTLQQVTDVSYGSIGGVKAHEFFEPSVRRRTVCLSAL